MRKAKIALLALTLVIALVVVGCGKKKAAAPSGAGPAAVSTARAEMGLLDNSTVISGKLEAGRSANIVAKVPGKVAAVHVDAGSRVSAGQVLVTLENKDLAGRVTQAQAAVAQAEAGLKSAQAVLANAQESFKVAEANYKRAQELLAAGAIPQATFEGQYELPYKQAKQAYVGTAPAQVELARAQLNQAKAQLALAQLTYEDSFIRAPFAGVVTSRNVNPGEMAANMPVISLAGIDRVVVKATVGEKLVNQIKQGQKVQVKISAVSGQPFTGVITSIAPAADPVTRAFPVKVEIDNSKDLLRPGMFAEVQLPSSGQKQLLVPREAVVKDGKRDYVWVVKQGKVQRREVKAGESDGKYIAIVSGLEAGDEVVTAGRESLQDGAKVTVKN